MKTQFLSAMFGAVLAIGAIALFGQSQSASAMTLPVNSIKNTPANVATGLPVTKVQHQRRNRVIHRGGGRRVIRRGGGGRRVIRRGGGRRVIRRGGGGRRVIRRGGGRRFVYSGRRHGPRLRHRRGRNRHFYNGFWYAVPWWLGTTYYNGPYIDEPYYGDAHVEWCLRRYRSYNPATDTYRGYDGFDHRCISPYR